jgi:hypothetical protein
MDRLNGKTKRFNKSAKAKDGNLDLRDQAAAHLADYPELLHKTDLCKFKPFFSSIPVDQWIV